MWGSVVSRNKIIKCRTKERGGHLPLGTLIIKCRTRERGGLLASRNTDYKVAIYHINPLHFPRQSNMEIFGSRLYPSLWSD